MAWAPLEKAANGYDVIIVGAGISGINFGYRLQERCPHLNYTILEGRHELGGTWSLFNYPGIRSDSDLFTFGFPWRPWKEDTAIAQGALIRKYIVESAEAYGIDKKIQYNTMVQAANYSTADKTWTVEAQVKGSEKPTRLTTRFLLMCTGYYDYDTPLQTQIPGLDNFQGQVIHPQFWPEHLDYSGKDVVVIGSGATAITVLPVMAQTAKRVTMLQRSPSYVMAVPTADAFERFMRRFFWWAPRFQAFMFRIKWILAPMLLTSFSASYPKQARALMYRITQKQLPKSVPRDPHFTPTYFPWEQRMCMCPDGDFFASLRTGKSSIETGTIDSITSDTIRLASGKELHPDIIVTATGLKLRFAGGLSLTIDGAPYSPPDHYVWKGMMLEDLPNAAFVVGYVDASWTLGADATAQSITRLLNRMKREGVVQVTPHRSADERANMKDERLLRLNSTYVTKAPNVLPKAGDRGQWKPRSNYIYDIFTAWFGDLKTSSEWIKG